MVAQRQEGHVNKLGVGATKNNEVGGETKGKRQTESWKSWVSSDLSLCPLRSASKEVHMYQTRQYCSS